MKQNKLEQFIRNNRHAFDDESPPADNWNEIERKIRSRKYFRQLDIRQILKWLSAAVVFIGITSIYFLYVREDSREVTNNTANHQTANNTASGTLESEYVQESKEIFKAISDRRIALKQLTDEQPSLYAQFTSDLAALDSAYNALRKEALNGNNQEVLLEAMLQNLRLQAALLAKQLSIIQQYSPNKIKVNEKENYRRI